MSNGSFFTYNWTIKSIRKWSTKEEYCSQSSKVSTRKKLKKWGN